MYTVKKLTAKSAPILLEHLIRLDQASVYNRFCTAANHEFLSRYVKQMDFNQSGIYGVFDEDLVLIGVGECVVYKDNNKESEVAFSIELPHQGKGLGNILMKRLIQFAKANDITKVNMYCLRTNTKSLHLAKKYGLNLKLESDEASTLISLPQTPAILHQSYEVADDIVANIDILRKNNSKLWKIQRELNDNLMKASFSYKTALKEKYLG